MQLALIDEGRMQSIISTQLDRLVSAVQKTLGPHGKTICLQQAGQFEPRLTKDGIPVARAVRFQDEAQVGSSLVQNALEKVDARAGDGTTSAAVFIKALYDSCGELLRSGKITLPELRKQLEIGVRRAV